MSTPPSFCFDFDATSNTPAAIPYVAKLQWDSQLKHIRHVIYPMTTEALNNNCTRVHGNFSASPFDIIETRRGALAKRRRTIDLTSWFLVAPRGYLLFLGDTRDERTFARITQYLQGACSAQDIAPQTTNVAFAISDWKALSEHPADSTSAQFRIHYLQQRQQQLEQELHLITGELQSLRSER